MKYPYLESAKVIAGAALFFLPLAGCDLNTEHDTNSRPAQQVVTPTINIKRSLVVTDLAILDSRFSLQRVMQQLVDTGGSRPGPGKLYREWWDTQNSAAVGRFPDAPKCDDETNDAGIPTFNGYPIDCPRTEGVLATTNPFGPPDDYRPLALFNRFDLAPEDGAHCGEYRITYGKTAASGPFSLLFPDRNLIIFEAQMPNPTPEAGLEGCRPIVEFWAFLSQLGSAHDRARALEHFYFEGLRGEHPPVIHAAHFAEGTGQIRTNQFMFFRQGIDGVFRLQPWQLREFKLANDCSDGSCRLEFVPVTAKGNPFGELFNDQSNLPQAAAFRGHFLTQVGALAENDINGFGMTTPDEFNALQSTSQGTEGDYVHHLRSGSGEFAQQIAAELEEIGSDLSPEHIVRRAMATSCAGCHQLNTASPANDLGAGMRWPQSLQFVHVSEQFLVPCKRFQPWKGLCWPISPALRNVFLPARKANMQSFLAGEQTIAPVNNFLRAVH